MAKRFTDTKLWEDPWFHGLPPRLKMAWAYICGACDGAGVWKVNLPLLSFYVGEAVSLEEFCSGFEKRVIWLSDESLWIRGFIRFQYNTLSPKNRAHRGIMKQLIGLTARLPLDEDTEELIESFRKSLLGDPQPHPTINRPPNEGQATPQVKEKVEVKVEVKEKGIEGGVGGVLPPEPPPQAMRIAPDDLDLCRTEWLTTLRRWGSPRSNLLPSEESLIARAILRQKSAKAVQYALAGKRHEQASEGYDPAKFLNLERVLSNERFQDFMNLGIAAAAKKQGKAG